MAKKLTEPTSRLGLHLVAGAADGILTSAECVLDETLSGESRIQNVQQTLDAARTDIMSLSQLIGDTYTKTQVDAKLEDYVRKVDEINTSDIVSICY